MSSQIPKMRLITFNTLKTVANRVGIQLENRTIVDLSLISDKEKHRFTDMLKIIDGGKIMTNDLKKIAQNPPTHSVISDKDIILKAPIALPRFVFTRGMFISFYI
jgi:hypothetical protein